ncbi:hypothetical protein GLOIN_2v940391 [Rhizophagus irregularis DAOM 181602=DAOM 197198]|nr:hypothetical protein GLOIN_2v940391 [Rhizophagus irregularis DAOM 181602=DAOM 197198]
MFEQLNVLESIHIIHCISLNTSFIQQILNLTKPFKLKSLFIDASSKIDESLLFLLQKSGGYLENFRYVYFRSELEHQKILESVIEYCKNIKLLGIFNVKDEIVYPVLNLIENIKQNLNCLSISCERSSLDNNTELFDFSDEVKEFKLHNIRVQRYSDSVIDNYKFMQKLD